MNKLIQSIYKAPIYQLGGQIDQPTPEEQEEFKMFIGDMIQSKQLNEQDVNEQNVPKLFQMYRQLKKQGKWKPKKMGMFKDGGKLSAYIPHGVMHRFEHKSGDVIKAKFGIEVTKKGIPVLSKDCNTGTCRYNQTAEVEKGEVIFDKPLMDKITAYRNRPDKAGELIYNALINLEGDTSRHEIKSR